MNRLTPSQFVGILLAVFVFSPLAWLISEPGVMKKMWIVVIYNPGFWVSIFLAIVFGLYKKFTNPQKFTWLELPVQLLVGVIGAFVIFSTLFYTSTDLSDKELWNGYVQMSEFLEKWDEKVTWEECVENDKNGNCTRYEKRTRIDHHPPEWYIYTNNGEKISISESVYKKYTSYYRREKKETLFHMNQVSIGDGNRFYVTYPGKIKPVWTAVVHPFVNYLAASGSIKLRKGGIEKYRKFLLPYPSVHNGPFGPIEIDRTLSAGVNVPAEWIKSVDCGLDEALTHLAKKKQVNILVYLVNISDQAFLHALEEYWVNGKKNDVVVIIGTTKFPKADWISVMAWTDIEEFKIVLRNNLLNLPDLSDSAKVVDIITNQVALSPKNGGFIRKPMVEYEYLVSDITLPLWINILIVFILGLINWATSWSLINNDISSINRNWRNDYEKTRR